MGTCLQRELKRMVAQIQRREEAVANCSFTPAKWPGKPDR